jgi:hypothetical protein
MSLRIGVDLDGVLADMQGELLRQAGLIFGKSVARRLRRAATEPAPGPPSPDSNSPASPDSNTGTAASSDGDTFTSPDIGTSATASDSITPALPASDAPACADTLDSDPPFPALTLTARQQRRLWHHVASIENFWETLKEIEPGSIARLAALATDRRWETIFLTKRPRSAGSTSQVQTQRWLESNGFRLPSVYVVQGSRGRIASALALDFVIDDTPENCLDVVVDSSARAILVWRGDEKHLPSAARRLGIGVVKSVDDCLGILAQVDAQSTDRPTVLDRVMRLLGLKEPAQV